MWLLLLLGCPRCRLGFEWRSDGGVMCRDIGDGCLGTCRQRDRDLLSLVVAIRIKREATEELAVQGEDAPDPAIVRCRDAPPAPAGTPWWRFESALDAVVREAHTAA